MNKKKVRLPRAQLALLAPPGVGCLALSLLDLRSQSICPPPPHFTGEFHGGVKMHL